MVINDHVTIFRDFLTSHHVTPFNYHVTTFQLPKTKVFPMNSISTSIFMAGLLAGALGFGNLSDRIGRRNGLLVAMLCGFISNLALYFVNDPITFTAVRFLSGGFAHACVIVSYVYVMEFLGPQGKV